MKLKMIAALGLAALSVALPSAASAQSSAPVLLAMASFAGSHAGTDAAREVEAAAYMINDLTAFRVDWMPFGGRGNAGLEMGGVESGIHDMTEEKLIVINAR